MLLLREGEREGQRHGGRETDTGVEEERKFASLLKELALLMVFTLSLSHHLCFAASCLFFPNPLTFSWLADCRLKIQKVTNVCALGTENLRFSLEVNA